MSEKIANIIEEVKAMTVLELSELVKAIEEEFGVSAAAAVAVAAPAGGAAAPERRGGARNGVVGGEPAAGVPGRRGA